MPVGNKRPQQQAASSSQALTATESTPLVAAKDDAPDDNPENPPGYLFVTNRTRGVYTTLAMVALAIATKEGSNSLYGATLSELTDYGYTTLSKYLPGIGSACYACGKASQIFIIYRLGARNVLALSAAVSGTGVLIFASGNLPLMYIGWMMEQFSNAHIWATSTRLIAAWVNGPEVGRSAATIAASNDLGVLIFTSIFSALQSHTKEYNEYLYTFSPYILMGCLLLFNSCLEYTLVRETPAEVGFIPPSAPPPSFGSSVKKIEGADGADAGKGKDGADGKASSESSSLKGGGKDGGKGAGLSVSTTRLPSGGQASGAKEGRAKEGRAMEGGASDGSQSTGSHPLDALDLTDALYSFAQHGRVWLCFIANAAFSLYYCMVNYIPTFAIDELGYSESDGTLLLTAVAIGSLVADLFGGIAMDKLPAATVKHIGHFAVACGVACGCLLIGLLCTGNRVVLASAMPWLVSVMSLACGFYWSVTITVFCIRFGGRTHVSTLSGGIDFCSYVFLIPYQFLFGGIVPHFVTMWSLSIAMYIIAIAASLALVIVDEKYPPLPAAILRPRPEKEIVLDI